MIKVVQICTGKMSVYTMRYRSRECFKFAHDEIYWITMALTLEHYCGLYNYDEITNSDDFKRLLEFRSLFYYKVKRNLH